MTGSAKQSTLHRDKNWIASSLTLLATTNLFVIPGRCEASNPE
jgi:hypothetical protein